MKLDLMSLKIRYATMSEEQFRWIRSEDLVAEARLVYDEEVFRRGSPEYQAQLASQPEESLSKTVRIPASLLTSKNWYYRRAGEERQGPFTGKALQELFDSGLLDGAAELWCERLADWVPASEVRHKRHNLGYFAGWFCGFIPLLAVLIGARGRREKREAHGVSVFHVSNRDVRHRCDGGFVRVHPSAPLDGMLGLPCSQRQC